LILCFAVLRIELRDSYLLKCTFKQYEARVEWLEDWSRYVLGS
jgi:hypothetical protein